MKQKKLQEHKRNGRWFEIAAWICNRYRIHC